MMPKVSVITCSHNRPEMLKAAIDSLRAQTDPDWEHLIYDDASDDKNVLEILEWARHDPRVRIWTGGENLDRPSVLWNFMFDRAHGRYFTVLDDDNAKLPTFIQAMSHELDADPDLDIVTCGCRVDRSEAKMRDEDYFINLSTSADRLALGSTCDGGAMLYRRSAFERTGYFSEELRTNEDWDWLRRAVHNGKVKNLDTVHSTYRSHKGSRMTRATALGQDGDSARVKERALSHSFGVRIACPDPKRLTQSQKDVCSSVTSALGAIPWVDRSFNARDLLLVVSPFQQSTPEIAVAVGGVPEAEFVLSATARAFVQSRVSKRVSKILSLHMEDPYALGTNLDRVQRMGQLAETWVCTNDISTVRYYRKVVGDRVIVCPSLSADSTVAPTDVRRDIDVLLCGYAYPSRKRFIASLLPFLGGLRVTLVGDGWEEHRRTVDTLPTQPVARTYALHARSRAVVCLHRVHGDCSDGPVEPETVNRGFMEGYSGPRVFLDQTRLYHAFDHGDVVWYNSPGDLAGALRAYLKESDNSEPSQFAEKCRILYTYQARLARVLNCVRAPRFLAEIP